MRLGIDIDETIVNTHTVAMKFANKYKPLINLNSYADLYRYERKKIFIKYLEDIQRNVELLPNVKESLMILKNKGFKFIFITARGSNHEYNYKGITEDMFNKYNVPYDKIIYKAYPKGQTASEEKIEYFIDDKEDNLDEISKYGIKCIRIVSDINMPSKHLKFDNWKDISNYLLREAGNKK